MTLDDIAALMAQMQRGGLRELDYAAGDARLRLIAADPAPKAAPATAPAEDTADPPLVRAPHLGLFRMAHPQRGAPEAAPGDPVRPGQIVAFVEAGAVFLPVITKSAGRLGACLVEDGALVGYAEPLFRLV